LEDQGLDGKIIFRWIYRKLNGRLGLNWSGSGEGQVGGTFKRGNDPSCFIKCGEFLDCLGTGWLLKKDAVPWSKQVSK
jgi:hypothetical protein